MNNPPPTDIANAWGHLPHMRQRGHNEWSSACPQCGDSGHNGNDAPDRFRMFAAESGKGARGWCRSCGYFAWAETNERPTPERVREATAERLLLAQQERERIAAKIRAVEQAAYWQGWHDAMTEKQRKLWYIEGIGDTAIDYYKLGFCPDHLYQHEGQTYHSPTMTIPHYGDGWHLTNVQHRLLNAVNGAGRYRQMAGLPPAMFRTEPGEPLKGALFVVEGAKKAIVVYDKLGKRSGLIVGLPGKAPSADMLESLANCEPIYLCLDPDAYMPTLAANGAVIPAAVNRLAAKLGPERVRIVKLPVKPDDFFVLHDGTIGDMLPYIRYSRRVN